MSSRTAHSGKSIPIAGLVRGGLLPIIIMLGIGCATAQVGATADDLTRARAATSEGANLFTRQCSQCHGQRGEGVSAAPAILGPGALPEFPRSIGAAGDPTVLDPQQLQIQQQSRPAGAASRDPFRNAQDVYAFVSTQMPKTRPGSLKEAEYWALVNFLFAVQGATLPAGGIGPANARSTPVPRR